MRAAVLFLPNLAHILYGGIPLIGQIWSIGVEEQFYLWWPWLMKGRQQLVKTILLFLAGFWLLKFVLTLLSRTYHDRLITIMLSYVHISSYDSLLLGGLGAWLVF